MQRLKLFLFYHFAFPQFLSEHLSSLAGPLRVGLGSLLAGFGFTEENTRLRRGGLVISERKPVQGP